MSAPRTKRQFAGAASDPAQRHITSFFSGCVVSSSTAVNVLPSPPLPASVQANLLSVGMRVRKSVPEGYKTGNCYSGFTLWSDQDGLPSPTPAVGQLTTTTVPGSTRRELLPFCGINKVGGMASQPEFDDGGGPTFSPASFDAGSALDSDDVPSLASSSQESAASVDSWSSSALPIPAMSVVHPAATNRKRFFENDNDEGVAPVSAPSVSDRVRVWQSEWLDAEVSPRSLAPVGWENTRVLAQPRGWAKRKAAAASSAAAANPFPSALGHENMAVDDFEDAEFLAYEPGDAEMGDV